MTTPWGLPDFDAHEDDPFITDEACGLKAIIAIHSTHLGPAAGGCALLALCEDEDGADRRAAAVARDELQERHGRASAGRRQVGDPRQPDRAQDARDAPRVRQRGRQLWRALRHRRGRRHERHRHDRGRAQTNIRRRPAGRAGDVGGDPGPHTSLGVFLGIKAAVKRALGKDNLDGLHIAMQGAGSVATGVALHACAEGARLSIADVDHDKAQKRWPTRSTGGTVVDPTRSSTSKPTCSAPTRSARSSTEQTIAALKAPIVAGGANNQLATPRGRRAAARPRHPLRARLCHQRRRHHQRLHRISRRRRRQPGARADRGHSRSGSSRSGPKAPAAGRDPGRGRRRHGAAADRQRLTRPAMHALRQSRARFLRFASPATGWLLASACSGRWRHGGGLILTPARLSAGRDRPHPLRPCARGVARHGRLGRDCRRQPEPDRLAPSARRRSPAGAFAPAARRSPPSAWSPARSGAARPGAPGGNGTGG